MAIKYNREQIALDLLLCNSNKEVCKKNNISEPTLFRLKRDPKFQAIVNEQKQKLFNTAMEKAQSYSVIALETLKEIITDKEAPASARVSASSKIIDLAQCINDTENITKKLEEIEMWLNESKEN